jgi:hypothetical protein
VTAQHIADRLIGDVISQIGERPDNPVIAPGAIFLRHTDNQFFNVLVNARPARGSPRRRSIEFASDKPSVPRKNCVRRRGGRYLAEGFAAKSMADLAERRTIGIRKPQPARELGLQDPVFGNNVLVP